MPPVPQVDELVTRLTEGKQTQYAKVRALYDYFSRQNGFSYSLSTQGGTSGEDIVNFLTSKVGFASSTPRHWPGWSGRPTSRAGWRSASPSAAAGRTTRTR